MGDSVRVFGHETTIGWNEAMEWYFKCTCNLGKWGLATQDEARDRATLHMQQFDGDPS